MPLVVVIASATCTPAFADQDDYLRPLLARYAFLSGDQLLTESIKICQIVRVGNGSFTAIPAVQSDLAVSVPVAADIVVAAISFRHC